MCKISAAILLGYLPKRLVEGVEFVSDSADFANFCTVQSDTDMEEHMEELW